MWHEARKQEKKIRGMMVDYKRRAERRRDYYERIKQDPAQFLQVHGRPAKIHLDPAIAIAAEGAATMMPWQGDNYNMIDRFDVRAHLDIIPEYKPTIDLPKLSGEEHLDDRKACYERYRTLVQNDFLGLNEDKFLHQIFLEERFGPVLKPAGEEEKKKLVDKKAAIGYVYEDSTTIDSPQLPPVIPKIPDDYDDDEEKDDWSDIDLDVTVDVSELTEPQCAEMNEQSLKYGMVQDDFITYLMQDKDEADQLRLAKEIEEEKAMFSGRKSRRERRALREKKLAGRKITSPPSYAARSSPTYAPMRHSTSKSRSRSKSPPNTGRIMFITSFGDEVSDGENLGHKDGKSGNSSSAKKHGSRLVKASTSKNVIGPLLPEEMGSVKKGNNVPASKTSVSSSASSSRTLQETKDRKTNNKHSSSSRARYRKRRHSSSSSSRSSCSPKNHSKRRDSSSRSSSRSRSRSRRSRSRSRSQSYSLSRKRSAKSRSRSRSQKKSNSPQLPPPPVKSYYRHSLSRSTSEISDDSDSQDKKEDSSPGKNSLLASKWQQLLGKAGPSTKSKLTPRERLNRKMQMAINRQYKMDKKAEMEKSEKQLQERMDRAEELREMAIRLRQRERERRHRLRGFGDDSDSDASYQKADYDLNVDPDHHRQSSKDRREYSRSRTYSSSDDERSLKSMSSKFQDESPRSTFSSQKRSQRSRSPVRDQKRSSPGPSHRKMDAARSSRRSPPRNSPPHRGSDKFSSRRGYQSRNGTYDHARQFERPKSRSRSPQRHRHSSYRRSRRSRSRSPRSSSSSYAGKSSRSLVDY